MNKAAPLFFVLRRWLLWPPLTRQEMHTPFQQSAALRRWGDARTQPAPLVIHEIAVSALSRAEFGCHYIDTEIEWQHREGSVLWYQTNAQFVRPA